MIEADFRLPVEGFARPGCIAQQDVHLRRTKVAGVDRHVPLVVEAQFRKNLLGELAHRVGLSGGDDVVVGPLLLEHQPHRLDVIAGESPVAFRLEIAEEELVLEAELDPGGRPGDLPGHEGLSAAGGFVVEEDAVGGKEVVRVPVVADDVVCVNLGGGVRALWLERGRLALGGRRRTEHLAGGGLVEAGLDSRLPDRLKEPDCSETRHVPGVLRHVKTHTDMALGAQVVNLIRPDLLEEVGKLSGNGEVAVVEVDPRLRVMEILVEVVDPFRVEGAGPADEAVDLIALAEQEFRQVGAVLAGDAGNQCFLHDKTSLKPVRIRPLWVRPVVMGSTPGTRRRSA